MSDDAANAAPEVVPADTGAPVEAVPEIVEPVAQAPVAETEAAHTETPTLLTGERPEAPAEATETPAEPPAESPAEADETKPADEPKEPEAAEAKPEGEVETEPTAEPEPLAYEPPTLPEGVELDAERMAAFDAAIGKVQVPPETRQQLVDMFLEERQAWEEHARQEQHRLFADTRRQWRDQVLGDEELGGAAHQTAIASCLRMIDQFVPEKDRAAFDQMLNITGAGDHPAMLKLLHSIARKFDAPGTVMQPNNPPPDRGGAGGRGRRMRDMYDHPRSHPG